jgi:hypothetical protein|tara:strand:- start:6294 stop:6689 length:396 start_codon:yes stop_codon:yes gene_type:complete
VEGVGTLADTFKNAGKDLTTTDLTTLYTVPTASPGVTGTSPVFPTTAVVKSILVCNDHGTATTLVDVVFTDTSASATIALFEQKSVAAKTTDELLEQPLVLEEGDVLKVQANAANQVHVTASILEITKGDL